MPIVNVYSTSVNSENISRFELLAWVNNCLQSNLTKIEEMASGAAYCQLTDLLFPTKVPLKKVKWNSRQEVDWMNNWRVLQHAWKEIGIDKPAPVQNLMRAKFQDNFEFLQWFKKFFEANYDGHAYNPAAARNFEEFPATLPGGTSKKAAQIAATVDARRSNVIVAPTGAQRTTSVSKPELPSATRRSMNVSGRAAAAAPTNGVPPNTRPFPSSGTSANSIKRRPLPNNSPQNNGAGVRKDHQVARTSARKSTAPVNVAPPSSRRLSTSRGGNEVVAQAEVQRLELKLKELETQNARLKSDLADSNKNVEFLERERGFYYSKLRSIEVLCGENTVVDGRVSVEELQKILWDRTEPPIENGGEIHQSANSTKLEEEISFKSSDLLGNDVVLGNAQDHGNSHDMAGLDDAFLNISDGAGNVSAFPMMTEMVVPTLEKQSELSNAEHEVEQQSNNNNNVDSSSIIEIAPTNNTFNIEDEGEGGLDDLKLPHSLISEQELQNAERSMERQKGAGGSATNINNDTYEVTKVGEED